MVYYKKAKHHKIGMIVPSSNTTMETEIPALLQRQQKNGKDTFSFHSSRIRLQQVTPDSLRRMNDAAGDAVDVLCDAHVDAIMYACLVAVMYSGKSCINNTQEKLLARAQHADHTPTVITSAGALLMSLHALSLKNVSMITPYKKELTEKVAATLGEDGITVIQTHSLEVVDNVTVGRLNTKNLLSIASQLDLSTSDALIISACVQMPSLDIIEEAEQKLGLPVISAATASAFQLLNNLNIQPAIPNAGTLLRNFKTVEEKIYHHAYY